MFAHRSKIQLASQIVAETPLLLPSFSSKGFPQVNKIMKLMGEFITGPTLVSAYDIHHKVVTQKITFSELIFLDSGGYEARYEHDLSEAYGRPHKTKPWSRRLHEATLNKWSSRWPTIAVTYDNPSQFQSLGDQLKAGRGLKENYPNFLWELLLKPEAKKDKFIGLEKILKRVHDLREFAVVGITEKEIDDSLFGAMKKIARLRKAMDTNDVRAPIHVFGSLDPLTSVLYFIAGAEIFDGLTWLRFGYHEGRTVYSQNYAAVHDSEGIRRRYADQSYEMWKNNYYYLEKLRTQMVNYFRTGDFANFGPIAGIVEDAHKQLQAVMHE
jgi:hypothetical protein